MKFIERALAAALLACGMAGAQAAYTGLTIFGDSLTDTGNVYAATGNSYPPAPYWNGRFSDGPVWVEYLAASLGLSATASLQGGQNYAFGGARTGSAANPVPDLLAQSVGLWAPTLGAGPADASRLYVLLGGGNDMRDARSAYQTNSAADQAGRQAAAQAAASNLINNLGFLASKGVTDVLLGNLPDLGRTPEAAALGLVGASTNASARFNALMPTVIAAGMSFGLHMSFVDLAATAEAIFDDALYNGGLRYGITNVATPCGGNPAVSCTVSAYFDGVHPTTRAHEWLGRAAYVALVPEPQTYALLALGLVALAWRPRRRAG